MPHPDRQPRADFLVAVLAVSVPLLAYLITLVRDPGWGDPAELTLQAWQWGVTHPPGAPAYVVLAGGVAHLGLEPAFACNLFSAVLSALAALWVALSVRGITGSRASALLAAWTFAFVRPIWTTAVVAELYPLSACFVSLTLFLLLRGRAFAAGLAFAFALGSYRPNLLLIPAALWLAWRIGPAGGRHALRFVLPALIGGAAWIAWDMARAPVVPPLGTEFVPGDLDGLLSFLSGSQYTSRGTPDPTFHPGRVVDHALRIGRYLLGGGLIFAVLGAVRLSRERLAGPLALWLALGLGYVTFHPYADYYLMTHASWVVLAVAIGCGIHEAIARSARFGATARRAVRVVATALPVLLFALQVPGFRAASSQPYGFEFAYQNLGWFPAGSVVISTWERFTVLLYFQRVHRMRPDVLFLERHERTRHYPSGTVHGWRSFARGALGSRPVFVDGEDRARDEPAAAFDGELQARMARPGMVPGSPGRVDWWRVERVR